MNKKITLVHLASSLKRGGAEAVLCDLVSRLEPDTFSHRVVYFREGPTIDRLHAMGVATYHVRGWLFRYDPIFFIRLYKLLKQLKPDLIHSLLGAANGIGCVMARLLRIPLVSVMHNTVDQDGVIRTIVDRLAILFSDRVVAVSPGVARSIEHSARFMPACTIEIICNGIDDTDVRHKGFLHQKNRYQLGLSDDNYIIGSVGRLHAPKRYELLLESFVLVNTTYPLTRLMLVGSGPQEQHLRRLAVRYGIEQMVIFVVDEQAYGYYPLFNCFALSSDNEDSSMALLEALSFGLPSIVTYTGSDHPIVQSGVNGLVVPAGNAYALAQGLQQLISDTSLSMRLGQAAQAMVGKKFCVDDMVQAYKRVFWYEATKR